MVSNHHKPISVGSIWSARTNGQLFASKNDVGTPCTLTSDGFGIRLRQKMGHKINFEFKLNNWRGLTRDTSFVQT